MTDTNKLSRPDDRITINFQAPNETEFKDVELFMSAGLVRTLAGYARIVEKEVDLFTDPNIQELLLTEALVSRTNRGKPRDPEIRLTDFDISIDEADKLLTWIQGHVLHFFTKGVTDLKNALENETGQIAKLMQSATGLQTLMEQKQSAGASAAN